MPSVWTIMENWTKRSNVTVSQKRTISIIKDRNNIAYKACKFHKIYILAEDEKYVYATIRTHGFTPYNPKYKGMKIVPDNKEKKDEIIRPFNSWIHGVENEIENPECLIITDINNDKLEYISKNILLALPKNKFKNYIDLEFVSEIDKKDLSNDKKIPIEDYENRIKECKDIILFDKNGKLKPEQMIYFVEECKHEVIKTDKWSTKVNMLELEKQNNLFYNKEKDSYEEILQNTGKNTNIE